MNRRRAVFPDRAAAVAAYTGRGGFRTWPDGMVADYVEGGFRDLPTGEVALTCDPEWEASNFTSHAHDTWAAIDVLSCPVDIYRAEDASTFQAGGRELVRVKRAHARAQGDGAGQVNAS